MANIIITKYITIDRLLLLLYIFVIYFVHRRLDKNAKQ